MIGASPIQTSPYHPQTDGLVERFNQTPKQLLRKLVDGEGHECNKLIPYVLFAYQEVPQVSTGFTPFELVYGRDVRGSLDVVKQKWTAEGREPDDVITYVSRIQEKLLEARELVRANMEKAQKEQKKWYDRRVREVNFNPGDKVLVLLPTRTEKLLAKWKGPYPVTKKLGRVNYEIAITDGQQRNKVFHVNILRKWHEKSQVFLNLVEDQQEEIPCYSQVEQDMGSAGYGSRLSHQQKAGIQRLIAQHPEITKKKHGRVKGFCHRIRTGDQLPVHQRPYRIPPAYREQVTKELQDMLEEGVIEPSTSEWSSPIVIVKKKDQDIRLCIDYRKVNAKTKFDAYPMPRIDEMLDNIGQSHYITTLDLMKGYWQVPMCAEDKKPARTNAVYDHAVWTKWSPRYISKDDGSSAPWNRGVCWSLLGRHRNLWNGLGGTFTEYQ